MAPGEEYPIKENTLSADAVDPKTGRFATDPTVHLASGAPRSTLGRTVEHAERIDGPTLTLTDFVDLCSVAGFCERAGGIWDLTSNLGSQRLVNMR